jgi:hypothetical protein
MASQPIYQFYAELKNYEPKIWRRFQVTRNITVARLGYIVMTMFEMQASHLFCIDVMYRKNLYKYTTGFFSIEEVKKRFSSSEIPEIHRYEVQNEMTVDFDDENAENATEVKISQIVSYDGDEMVLSYDYGDGWEVNIILEKIFEDKKLPGKELPRVLNGKGYGIVEDCGGVGGLEEIAEAFKLKKGEQYEELCEWLGMTDLDLDSFDIDDMNYRLKKIPRIYADAYEYGLEPTKQSMDLLMRKYKK